MNEWILITNGKNEIFNDYQEALNSFLTRIADHLWENSYNNKDNNSAVYDYCCTPNIVGEFFESDYNDRTILDEEIVIQSRLNMLLDFFLSKDANEIKNNALKVIKKPIKYCATNLEYADEIEVIVEFNQKEISVNIRREDSIFKTNAFIFDNNLQRYYFNSKQRITTSNDPEHLGKIVELDTVLQPYDDEIKEKLYQKQKSESEAYIIGQYRKYARLDKNTKIIEIDEWALNKVSAENNYDVHELRELLLSAHK